MRADCHLLDGGVVDVEPFGGDPVEGGVVEDDDGVGVERQPLPCVGRVSCTLWRHARHNYYTY